MLKGKGQIASRNFPEFLGNLVDILHIFPQAQGGAVEVIGQYPQLVLGLVFYGLPSSARTSPPRDT